MTLSFSTGLSFEKSLGLLITPLCLLACGNPLTVVSAPLRLPFFFILTSLKASRTYLDLNKVYKTFLKSSINIVNATIHIKNRILYVKPECFRYHKSKCLLQNQKKTLVLLFSYTSFLWIKTTHPDKKLFM